MSEIFDVLFGSRSKARLLRFFLLNNNHEYSLKEIRERNMLSVGEVRREINKLKKIKFITEKTSKKKKVYRVNLSFPFYPELRSLIAKSNIFPQCKSLKKIKNIGNVSLALISGVFLNYNKGKADLLLAADSVSKAKLKRIIETLEAEVGKEISYVLMTTDELKYRLNMLDRFVLDFFKDPHEEIINKIPKLKNFITSIKVKNN